MTGETLGDLVRSKAVACGDRVALEFGDRVTTFAEVDAESDLVASALIRAGMRPGDRIAYLGKNSDRYFILLFGAAKAGLAMVPIGWRLGASEINYLLADSDAARLFIEPAFADLARRAVPPGLAMISTEAAAEEIPAYVDWLAGGRAADDTSPQVDPASPVLQLYTSGTTGQPKGAMIAHDAIYPLRPLCAAAGLEWDRWGPDEVSLLTMPVAHIAGTGWGLVGFYNAAKTIALPDFDPGEVIRRLSTERIGRIFLVPTALAMLLRHPSASDGDYSRLNYILYGASPIPLPVLQQAIKVFGCDFVQNYGMTETCGSVVVLSPEDHDAAGNERMRSAGRSLPGVSIRIIDERTNTLPVGEVGQVMVRSPTNMIGYWKRPEATRETLVDGWIGTGDAGYLDAEGYLFICDRMKDMIISGGENVYPIEVEAVLHGHPMVADVAVIGVPDSHWGEAVTAIIVASDPEADADAIIKWARQHLAPYKTPKQIIFRETLPRNVNGKILKRELRAPFWHGRQRGVN